MESKQVDKVRTFFAEKRQSRRQAIQGAAALAATGLLAGGVKAAAQDDSLFSRTLDPSEKPEFLFVQSFQGGSIAAKDGEAGAYTVTLEQGLGSTIYFSDRPDRIVGATPTAQFTRGFGFGAENPPNAALLISNDDGETDVAVVELTNPVYDEASHTATYDMQLLENFDDFSGTFQSDPVDLGEIAASFGTAHLFIDSCSDGTVFCVDNVTNIERYDLQNPMQGFCFQWGHCQPCLPYVHDSPTPCATWYAWAESCRGNKILCPSGDCNPYWDNGGAKSTQIGCP